MLAGEASEAQGADFGVAVLRGLWDLFAGDGEGAWRVGREAGRDGCAGDEAGTRGRPTVTGPLPARTA